MVGALEESAAISGFGAGVGMGIRKADADLTKMFNEAMDASFKDGSVKKMSLDWFKIDTAP